MSVIPFSLDDVYEGFAECEGIARFENDVLVLEFQTRDAFIGVVKSAATHVELPLDAIGDVSVEKRFWKTHLVIRATRLDAIESIPTSRRGEVKLRIKGEHRELAHDLASEISLRLGERRLAKLEEERNRL